LWYVDEERKKETKKEKGERNFENSVGMGPRDRLANVGCTNVGCTPTFDQR
jgi:hypothetical protein